MKKSKLWVIVLIYWGIFVLYNIFLEPISALFPFYDFTEGSGVYHYGACSFSITVSLVLLALAIICVLLKNRKHQLLKKDTSKVAIAIGVLILSAVIHIFYYLSHFSYFYLFGIIL